MKSRKFNIIDILVVLIIIVFGIGIGIRVINGKTIKEQKEITYIVEVENVKDFTVNALKKSDLLTDEKTGTVLGEILSVEEDIYKKEEQTSTGELISVEIPERYRCILTIKSTAKESEGKFMLDEKTEVVPGKEISVITKYVKTTGNVISVRTAEAENE